MSRARWPGCWSQMMVWRHPKVWESPCETNWAWGCRKSETWLYHHQLYQPPCTFLPAFLQTRCSSSSYSWWHLDLGIRWRGTMHSAMHLPSQRHPWRHWTSPHPSPTSWVGGKGWEITDSWCPSMWHTGTSRNHCDGPHFSTPPVLLVSANNCTAHSHSWGSVIKQKIRSCQKGA